MQANSITQLKHDLSVLERIAFISMIGLLFFIPTIMVIKNILLGVTLVILLFTLFNPKEYLEKKIILSEHTYLFWLVGLWIFSVITISFSTAPKDYAISEALKTIRFLYPLFLVPFFVKVNRKEVFLKSFILGVFVAFILCVIATWHPALIYPLNHGKYEASYPFINHIFGSFIDSFAVFFCLHQITQDKSRWRYFFILVALLAIIQILIFNQSRTGYIELLFFIGIFVFQKANLKLLVTAVILFSIIFTGLALYYTPFKNRISLVVKEQQIYTQHHEVGTSTGWRRYAFGKSFVISASSPWFGHGLGSFQQEFINKFCNHDHCSNTVLGLSTSPQNQFLLVLVEEGLLGLSLLVLFFVAAWRHTFKLEKIYRQLAQGLILGFIILSFSDVTLLASISGDFFIVMSSLLLAYEPKINRVSLSQS